MSGTLSLIFLMSPIGGPLGTGEWSQSVNKPIGSHYCGCQNGSGIKNNNNKKGIFAFLADFMIFSG